MQASTEAESPGPLMHGCAVLVMVAAFANLQVHAGLACPMACELYAFAAYVLFVVTNGVLDTWHASSDSDSCDAQLHCCCE
jgi:hypothetical protein